MSYTSHPGRLPDCSALENSILVLDLPISCSELHGIMCGYLCAGALHEGELYLRALLLKKENNGTTREAARALFEVYEISKQHIGALDFEFALLLPEDDVALPERAQAFGEWCEGFTRGLTLAGVDDTDFEDEDSQEALQHFVEFADLDYQALQTDENDEKALMEVSEYARMAVLRLSGDLQTGKSDGKPSDTAH